MSKFFVVSFCCIFVATQSLLVSCGPATSNSNNNSSSLSSPKSINKTAAEIKTPKTETIQVKNEETSSSLCDLPPAKARLFPYEDFQTKGKQEKSYESRRHGDCMKLTDSVESINTCGTCIRMYKNADCTSDFVVLAPGTESHNKIANLFLSKQLPKSIGAC